MTGLGRVVQWGEVGLWERLFPGVDFDAHEPCFSPVGGLSLSKWTIFHAMELNTLHDVYFSLRRVARLWDRPSLRQPLDPIQLLGFSSALFSFGLDVSNFLSFFSDLDSPWSPYPFDVEVQSLPVSLHPGSFEYPVQDSWPLWASQSCDLPSSALIFPECLLGEFSLDVPFSSLRDENASYAPPTWLRVSVDPGSHRPAVFLNRRRVLFCWFGFSAFALSGFGPLCLWFFLFSACGNWVVAARRFSSDGSWFNLIGSRSRVIGKGLLMRRSSRSRCVPEKAELLPFVPFPVSNPPTQSGGFFGCSTPCSSVSFFCFLARH